MSNEGQGLRDESYGESNSEGMKGYAERGGGRWLAGFAAVKGKVSGGH